MHFTTALQLCKLFLVLFALQQISVNGDSAEDYAKNLKVPPRFGKRGDAVDYDTPKFEAGTEEVFEPVSSQPQQVQLLSSGHAPSPLMVKYFCRLVQRRLLSARQCFH